MKIKIVVHTAEEGGYWGEVPGLPGCFSQGESLDELFSNMQEAIEGYLMATNIDAEIEPSAEVYELAV